MHFHNTETLKHPLPLVWATLRDRMTEIVATQDDIKYITVDKRTKKGAHKTHVVSTWSADPPLPAFLKGFIKPDMLIWTDDAMWDDSTTICTFSIITHYKIEDIRCMGTIAVEAVNAKNTRIIYSGELTIKKTAKSSIFMTGLIIKGIEAVASKIIEHNFSKTMKTLDAAIKNK